MDKEQAVDERELVRNCLCLPRVCVHAHVPVCTSLSMWYTCRQEYNCVDVLSETVALYITQLYCTGMADVTDIQGRDGETEDVEAYLSASFTDLSVLYLKWLKIMSDCTQQYLFKAAFLI